jgi:DNA repair protein RadC
MLDEWGESLVGYENTVLPNDISRLDDYVLLAKWLEPNNPIVAFSVAEYILTKINFDWTKLSDFNEREMPIIFGISSIYARRLSVLKEITHRIQREKISHITHLYSPSCVFEIMKPYLSQLKHEEFYALYVDNAKKLLAISLISKGGLTATLADGRIIFNKALLFQATGIILCHNHPSGIKKESKADIILTKNLCEFGKFIEVSILDHIIFTDNGYLSFQVEGLLS